MLATTSSREPFHLSLFASPSSSGYDPFFVRVVATKTWFVLDTDLVVPNEEIGFRQDFVGTTVTAGET